MILQRRQSMRKALAGVALVLTMVVGLAGPSAAEAAFNASVETVTAGTSCDNRTRQITLGASFTLTSAHMNGAWVAYQYRFFQVNGAGARISGYYNENWRGPFAVHTWASSPNLLGGPVMTNTPVQLNGGTYTLEGNLRAEINIAVWTGSGYRYTGWIRFTQYTNIYAMRYGGAEATVLADCYTVWPY